MEASDGTGMLTRDSGAGDVFTLGSKSNGTYVFRLGDGEANNGKNGNKGFDGIVGSGWLTVNGEHSGTNDFLFTASQVPEPPGFLGSESVVALLAIIGFAGLA
ncbi:MAG: hypothetical protein KDN22_06385, partial [Verrucomicrobiae bacterium]|nr:hypothetical protein [Verrucomicrobiae bacterium]